MKIVLTLLAAALVSTGAMAAGYSEKKSGDLSNDGLDPTAVKVKVGKNVISGVDGRNNSGVDRDYFKITVPKGSVLASVIVGKKTQVGGFVSFIGVEAGDQVTTDPNGNDPSALLGWSHYSSADDGTDILPAICQGAGAKGCTAPLPAGDYSFWLQELSTCQCKYSFTLTIAKANDEEVAQ